MSKAQLIRLIQEMEISGFEYDEEANCLYLHTNNDSKVAKTLEMTERINLDIDAKSDIVGIEVLDIEPEDLTFENFVITLSRIKRSIVQHT